MDAKIDRMLTDPEGYCRDVRAQRRREVEQGMRWLPKWLRRWLR